MEGNFEEKAGLVTTITSWGNWGQTVEDVLIEVNLKSGTNSKAVKCDIRHKDIKIIIEGSAILQVIQLWTEQLPRHVVLSSSDASNGCYGFFPNGILFCNLKVNWTLICTKHQGALATTPIKYDYSILNSYGELFGGILKDESVWTLEDKKLLRIVLPKSHRDASNCWKSLLANGEYAVDPFTFQEMEKKLTLERFQRENPGFDFSKAEVSGQFQGGGPQFSKR